MENVCFLTQKGSYIEILLRTFISVASFPSCFNYWHHHVMLYVIWSDWSWLAGALRVPWQRGQTLQTDQCISHVFLKYYHHSFTAFQGLVFPSGNASLMRDWLTQSPLRPISVFLSFCLGTAAILECTHAHINRVLQLHPWQRWQGRHSWG